MQPDTTPPPEGDLGVEAAKEWLQAEGFVPVLMKPSVNDPRQAIIVFESEGKLSIVVVVSGDTTTQFDNLTDLLDWVKAKKAEAIGIR